MTIHTDIIDADGHVWEMRGKVEAPLCQQKPSDYIRSGRVYFHAENCEHLIVLPQK